MTNAIEQATFSFDRAALQPFADRMQQTFATAKPFSYAMVDGIFPPEVLEAVLAEFPEPEQAPWQSFDQATEVGLRTNNLKTISDPRSWGIGFSKRSEERR